jgi:hypothetical protein
MGCCKAQTPEEMNKIRCSTPFGWAPAQHRFFYLDLPCPTSLLCNNPQPKMDLSQPDAENPVNVAAGSGKEVEGV